MADIAKGNYWEAYGPANFEVDQFQMTLDLVVVGGTGGHHVISNGSIQTLGAEHWRIEFPPYFTSSSFFAHLSNDVFTIQSVYSGQEKSIPIQVYSKDAKLADEAFQKSLRHPGRTRIDLRPVPSFELHGLYFWQRRNGILWRDHHERISDSARNDSFLVCARRDAIGWTLGMDR